jgi:putative nucleotidyltransferase with HDIG domain
MAPVDPPDIAAAIPPPVRDLIETLRAAGHAAYVVGGSLRDVLLGREVHDWDLATDARPERMLELFPRAVYENAFGTVGVRRDGETFQITTFRSDHDYADFRRPHRVEFGDRIEDDLARRDFTVNAMAWGGPADGTVPLAVVDPFGGAADLERRRLRAVGEPRKRFEEDALRMLRAVRFASTLRFTIDPPTLAAIREHAPLARHLSGERVAMELDKLLASEHPSLGLSLAADVGLLAALFPELEAQRGIAQNKVPGEDLWRHTLRTVDASPRENAVVRLAALLHDVGKPPTLADGRFMGHDTVGAEVAEAILERLHASRERIGRVTHLIRHHMFHLGRGATDAAIRRFIVRIGEDRVEDLIDLRAADNVGSGLAADAGGTEELRRRIRGQLAAQVALDRYRLAVDGHDVMAELGIGPGPALGDILEALTERVIADPALNERATLLDLARGLHPRGAGAGR